MARLFTTCLLFGLCIVVSGRQIQTEHFWPQVPPTECNIDEILKYPDVNVTIIACDQEGILVEHGTRCEVSICISSNYTRTERVRCEYGNWKNTATAEQHRRKRGWGFVALAVACYFFCGGGGGGGTQSPPTFSTCHPADLSHELTVPAGRTSRQVTWTPPTATDPDSDDVPTVEQTGGTSRGGIFRGSTNGKSHQITYKATDGDGLTAYCTFTFEVLILSCSPLPYPSHGNRDCPDGNILGASCTYSCDEGYELSEDKVITCQDEANPSWTSAPTCNSITCGEPPADLENGYVSCRNESYEYRSVCSLKCNPGYALVGDDVFIDCHTDQTWSQHSSFCRDAIAPSLTCVTPQILDADRGLTSTAATWKIPTATDNVEGGIDINMKNGPEPGTLIFGTSYVEYEASDAAGNISPTCTIELRVQQINCVHPLDTVDDPYIQFECNDLTYVYGTQCNVSCLLNLPLSGTNLFTCEKRNTSDDNPEGYWSWGTGDKPFCELIACRELSPPVNGALVQDFVQLRPVYTMFCNANYTIASSIEVNGINVNFNGLFTCTDSGNWVPIDYAPGCTQPKTPRNAGLLADLLYYSGECGTDAANEAILVQFAKILANVTEFYQTLCPSFESCSADNPKIVCGDISGRKKRYDDEQKGRDKVYRDRRSSVDSRFEKEDGVHALVKRQTTYTHYIQISFYINIAWNPPSNMSIDDAFVYYDGIHAELTAATHDKASEDWFTIDNGPFQMTLDEDPLQTEPWSNFQCDDGEMLQSIYCVPCPVGHYLDNDACARCPRGTYSDSEGASTCTSCQPGYSTRDIGSNLTAQCIPLCNPGRYSPDGLETCSLCPVGTYQSGQGQSTCLQCPSATTTIEAGSSTMDQCVDFDVLIRSSQGLITLYEPAADLSSTSVDFWFKYVTAQPIVQLEVSSIVSLTIADIITVDTSDSTTTLEQVLSSTWNHLALVFDVANNMAEVYLNGEEVFRQENLLSDDAMDNLSGQSGSVTLSNNGSAAVYISGLQIAPSPLEEAEVQAKAASCLASTGSDVANMDVFTTQSVPGITVSAPSTCDAINECLTNPCGDHTCINEAGGYTCVCSRGTTGTNCEIPPDYCAGNKCENGATCTAGNGDYNCTCRAGFSGQYCDIEPLAGQWSPWSPWGECSQTCGGGTSTRQRSCDSPPPEEFGADCVGDQTEGISCNTDTCRSCPTLRRELNTMKQCETDTTTGNEQCTLYCLDGERFPPGTNGSQEVYTCGPETEYSWEPKATTLACVSMTKPRELSITTTVPYTSQINESDESDLEYAIQGNAAGVPCYDVPACTLSVTGSGVSTRRRRSTGTDITLVFTVPLTDTGDLNLAEFIQNQTVSSSLQEVIDAINGLEATATYIQDNFNSIFDVTLSGVTYTADASSLQVQANVECDSGQAAADGLCSDCPIGTYLSNNYCHLCEKGSYQDTAGQSACIECPAGYTTVSIGSTASSQCSETASSTENSQTTPVPGTSDSDSDNKVAYIAVGVSIGALLLAVLAIAIAIRIYLKKKSIRRIASEVDVRFQNVPPVTTVPKYKSRPSSSLSVSRHISVEFVRTDTPPPAYSEKDGGKLPPKY